MAVLSSKARNMLSDKTFAYPKERKYPINDPAHARNALARASQHLGPSGVAKVKSAVRKKFPSIKVS